MPEAAGEPPLAPAVSLLGVSEALVLSPVVLVLVVEVALVDVVDAAAFSALVSAGGTMLGVLLGTDSETLLPPQAASASAQASAASAARVRVALTPGTPAAPCACRRWGSR